MSKRLKLSEEIIDDVFSTNSSISENDSDTENSPLSNQQIQHDSSENVKPQNENIPKSILKTQFKVKNSLKVTTNRKRISFHQVEVFYFNRQQSFCSVPSIGGSALGMEMRHFVSEKFDFDKDDIRIFTENVSWESKEKSNHEKYSILQPIIAKNRRILLRNSGTSRIETIDKEICDLIRSSRERCGCQCVGGNCLPETCICALNDIQCQVDRGNFPCACGLGPCSNPVGRIEFNPIRVRTHFIHTIMRLQMHDQYQSDYSVDSSLSSSPSGSPERPKLELSYAKEFDINICNSTDQGSCRDCQNDKYLQVLMSEWTHQLQKLHSSRHYPPALSFSYNSWNYGPENFCSGIYWCKDSSTFSFLPYNNYTFNSLSGFELTNQHIQYPSDHTYSLYRPNSSLYDNNPTSQSISLNREAKSLNMGSEDFVTSLKYDKDLVIEKPKVLSESEIIKTNHRNSSLSSRQCISELEQKLLSRPRSGTSDYYLCKSTENDFCKYDSLTTLVSLDHADKDICFDPSSSFVNSVHYPTSTEKGCDCQGFDQSVVTEDRNDLTLVPWESGHNDPRITHASNGQLYTVLQPVSQSGIVSNFYKNSQASDSCKYCKYKSTTESSRQRITNLCVADLSLPTDIYSQASMQCTDSSSEVCA